jgi:hypothetical protein
MARKHPYRREDGMAVVDVALSDIRLLFSQLDPSPVREKDLDPSTEAYIMGAIRELGGGRPLVKIVFHVPADQFASLDSASWWTPSAITFPTAPGRKGRPSKPWAAPPGYPW